MRKPPECPKGHGALEFRAVEERHFDDGEVTHMAVWVCRECGHHDVHPASEFEETSRVCDFCSRPNPVKVYGCQSFSYIIVAFDDRGILASQPAHSEGEWLACVPCAAFIDANDRKGLTERVVENMASAVIRANPEKRKVVADSLRQLHAQFFRYRIP